ncbi:MAG: hypothetical protein HZB25_03060 [Candidatus Eisenbacteria bacterium]|nr:hypothetical protein [Candidatus Eisenbacteria bacterium]
MTQDVFQTSMRDIATVVFRHLRAVVIIVVTALVCALAWMFLLREDAYEVSAKLLVRIGREQAAPTTVLDPRSMFIAERALDVNSEVEILYNRELLAGVVDQLGLDRAPAAAPAPRGPFAWARHQLRQAVLGIRTRITDALVVLGFREKLTPRQQAIAMLEHSLRVTRQRDSNIVVATLTLPAREGASLVLNTIIDRYQRFRSTLFQDRSAVNFFRLRAGESRSRLAATEQELQRFERAGGIRSLEDQKRTLVGQLAELQNAEDEAGLACQEARARVERFEAQASQHDPDFSSVGSFKEGSYLQQLIVDLSALRRERERLKLVELEDGRRAQNTQRQFDLVMGLLRSSLRTDLLERQASQEARRRARARAQAQLDSLQQEQMTWTSMKRALAGLEENDALYRRKLEEASATSALGQQGIGNVAVVEYATDPLGPSGMRKSMLLLVCLAVSLFAAAAWVTLTEFFDHRIHTAEALEQWAGAPVIATVLDAALHSSAGAGGAALPAPDPGPAAVFSAPPASYAKAALALAGMAASGPVRAFLLCGAGAGCGTTTAAVRIGRELQEGLGLRALVVEFRRHQPVLATAFGLDPRRSLQAIAHGTAQARETLQATSWGFSAVPAAGNSSPAPNDAELVDALRAVLAAAEGSFDMVLVETPPILEGTEALVAGAVVPRVILVAEAGRTRFEMLERIRQDLSMHRMAILGAILNRRQLVVPGWFYRRLVGQADR